MPDTGNDNFVAFDPVADDVRTDRNQLMITAYHAATAWRYGQAIASLFNATDQIDSGARIELQPIIENFVQMDERQRRPCDDHFQLVRVGCRGRNFLTAQPGV
jgi:hypothetical protein